MQRPDDLTIKLHHDEVHYHEEDGFGYFLTPVGSSLWTLCQMWGMSYAQVVEKIAHEAVEKEEDEFIIDGEYIPPHARGGNGWPHQSKNDGPVVYH